MFLNHGITREKRKLNKKNLGFWHYEQHYLGFNYRMNEISAALGLSQLKKLNMIINKRNKLANNYKRLIKDLPLNFQKVIKFNKSSYHLFIVVIDGKKVKKNYNNIFNKLRKNGLLVNLHYSPIHLQPYYKKLGFKVGDFPVSESYGKSALSLPLYYDLTLEDQKKIVKTLSKVIS